jgi:hypothetical protein
MHASDPRSRLVVCQRKVAVDLRLSYNGPSLFAFLPPSHIMPPVDNYPSEFVSKFDQSLISHHGRGVIWSTFNYVENLTSKT